MSEMPNSERLALFTFDDNNTLTVTDPTIPPIVFDEMNVRVSSSHIEPFNAPLQFTNENVLITELPSSPVPTIPEAGASGLSVANANTWPRHYTTCSYAPSQALPVEPLVSAEPTDNPTILRLLIETSTASELREMITAMHMHLGIRRLSAVPDMTAETQISVVEKKGKKRWMKTLIVRLGSRMWRRGKGGRGSTRRSETLSAMETAYASDADAEV